MPSALDAQNRYFDHWHFGHGAALDFTSGSPEYYSGALDTREGSAAISDPVTGELLFYTDGVFAYNRQHELMSNGDSLGGHWSSAQSATIVPHPGDSNLYYILTADAGDYADPYRVGINYSIVDMREEGGLGAVVTKQVQLLDTATEQLVALKACNRIDYWVVARKAYSDEVYAWRIGRDGIDTTPTVSVVEQEMSYPIGTLKASPDSQYLSSVSVGRSRAEVFTFDAETGRVGEMIMDVRAGYGSSFSPNSRYLYVSERGSVVRYDLTADSLGKESLVLNVPEAPWPSGLMSFQLASDGNLYAAAAYDRIVVTVKNPDAKSPVMKHTDLPIPLQAMDIVSGLPNCIDAFFSSLDYTVVPDAEALIALDDTTICAGESVDLYDTSTGGPFTRRWHIQGGSIATDTTQNPGLVRFDRTGLYSVVLELRKECGFRFDTVHVQVEPLPVLDAGGVRSMCVGDSVIFDLPPEYDYEWQPARGLSCVDCPDPVASPSDTIQYVVRAESDQGCVTYDSVTVNVIPFEPPAGMADTSVCIGGSVVLQADEADAYEWSYSSKLSCLDCRTPTVTPEANREYVVRGILENGCDWFDTVEVVVLPRPSANAGRDRSICVGESVQLGKRRDTAGLDIVWSPSRDLSSPHTPNPVASPRTTTSYVLTVTDEETGCALNDTVVVSVRNTPVADAGDDVKLCGADLSATLGAADYPDKPALAFEWNPARGLDDPTVSQPTATPATTTQYVLTVVDTATGCFDYDTVNVFRFDAPTADAGSDVTVCRGDTARLGGNATTQDGVVLSWNPVVDLSDAGIRQPTAWPSNTTEYVLTVIDTSSGCRMSDTVVVTVKDIPDVTARPDTTICAGAPVRLSADYDVLDPDLDVRWYPADRLDDPTSSNPIARPDRTTDFVVEIRNRETACIGRDTVRVTVRESAVLSTRTSYEATHGSSSEVLVTLYVDGVERSLDIDEIEIVFTFDPLRIGISEESVEELLPTTLLEGWAISRERISAGSVRVRASAPPGSVLNGSGPLLRFFSTRYLGDNATADIQFVSSISRQCVQIETADLSIPLDSICGLDSRLIVFGPSDKSVLRVSPNPAQDRAILEFGLPLDGHVELEVWNARGRRVETPVNAEMDAGHYTLQIDAEWYSAGVYWIRLRHGDRMESTRLLIR